jgi:hypothetical protein
MKRITVPITLKVQGPILTKSSSIGALGLDAVMARRAFDNPETGETEERYYLPGRLVKGLLREAWQELSTADASFGERISEWLGDESVTDSDDAPARGRLAFDDFADRRTVPGAKDTRFRIEVDEIRGAAAGQQMQMMESPYAPGQVVDFEGRARFLIADEEDASGLREALQRGLLWIEAAGGTRTSGFGQLLDVTFGKEEARLLGSGASMGGPAWDLRLSFREPVVFSKRRVSDNLFESGEVIPGGALKGAVAEMASREPETFRELLRELHAVRFTHAFPAAKGAPRPRHWPLSLMSFGEGGIVDAIRRRQPFARAIQSEDPEAKPQWRAGAFDIDWKEKERDKVRGDYGWPKRIPDEGAPKLKWELRVRTGIDSARRKAADERLFAWKMLLPYGFEWIARVETSQISEAARSQLEALLRFGLEPLGKTKALAESTPTAAQPAPTPAAPYVVTLQTPTLLIDPSRRLAPNGGTGSASEDDLEREFQDVWRELSNGSLRLSNYFQRCSLAGGQYFQRRFLRANARYKPYLLSSEGSTFLLEPTPGKEKEANARLDEWLRMGLPLSASVRRFYDIPDDLADQWKHCPYLPENGYGEIAVNDRGPYPEA